MSNDKKSKIGTSDYFSEITQYTVFSGIRMTSPKAFSDCVTIIAGKASKALSEIYVDICLNSKTIKFISDQYIDNIRKFSTNLYEIKDFANISMNKSANDIYTKLASLRLKSSVSIRDIEKAAEDIVKSNPLKISDRDKKELVEKAIKSGVSVGDDQTQRDYLEVLFKKYNKDAISAALDYLECNSKTNKGKNDLLIGSPPYIEMLACNVFGSKFAKSSLFRTFDKSYKDGINKQYEFIADKIKQDVKTAYSRSEYMEYDMRERLKAVMAQISRNVPSNPASGFDKELERLRRLEDFDNKIIKIDKKGSFYPVDVQLNWENGKNVLYISAKINFSYFNPIDGIKEFLNLNVKDTRKKNALNSFKRWDNGGNEYKNVFGNQSVTVVVDLKETQSKNDSIRVFLDMPGDYSMGWGGVGLIDWTTFTKKLVLLSDSNNPNGTATHEFGHILGLGDAYVAKYIKTPWLYWSEGVDYKKYPAAAGTVMDSGNAPISKDIEMVIYAFYTGKRQNYAKECFWHNVSPVLGK